MFLHHSEENPKGATWESLFVPFYRSDMFKSNYLRKRVGLMKWKIYQTQPG